MRKPDRQKADAIGLLAVDCSPRRQKGFRMTHKNIFIAASVVLLIFGLVWLVIPDIGLSLYGHEVTATDMTSTITRYWGSAFIALAAMTWLARKGQADSIGVRAIIIGGFVLAVSGLIVAVIDLLIGSSNALVWLNIALYAIFAALFGILAFKKPA
jgi:hypothetical protein